MIVFIMLFYSMISYSNDFVSNGIYYEITSESNKEVGVVYNSKAIYSGNIKIPETVFNNGIEYKVTSIGTNAFFNQTLTSIILGNNITLIDDSAFAECYSLNSVECGVSLTEIGPFVFSGCSKLKNISLNDNLRTIGISAFYKCSNLEEIIFPNTLISIGRSAFKNCTGIKKIILPSSIQSIGEEAFRSCTLLEDVYIPSSLKTIPKSCFSECSISKLEISNGVERIEEFAFTDIQAETVILPPSVLYIGQYGMSHDWSRNLNLIILNGDFTFESAFLYTSYYILDNQVPRINDPNKATQINFYVPDKELFISSSGVSEKIVHQLNEGIEKISLKYSGMNQGPNRNSMKWEIGEFLKSIGISFTFQGIQNSDCGHWVDTEDVIFSYKDWSKILQIYYDYTITPIPLNVTVNDASRNYGENNPDFSVSLDGLVESDLNKNVLENVVYKTDAHLKSNVGEYSISVTAESKNYTLNYKPGKLTIFKSPIIVYASNIEKKYGDPNPKIEFNYEGLKFDDTESNSFSVIPTALINATETSDVGEYPIKVSGGVSKNYEITEYRAGILTITKAPATIIATDMTRSYYEDNPEFGFTIDGLRNNEDSSCITKKPIYNCSANLKSDCGEYSIVPSNADAKNYEFSYKDGKLTINPASLILAATNISREYGEHNPILKYEAIGLKGDDELLKSILEEPILSTTAIEASNVGEYPITISGGRAKNYNISYKQGILTVNKAPLTVFAKDIERIYGDSNPTFSMSFLGFKLNDTEASSFSLLPRISCSATKTSDVGEYPIMVEGGTTRNYEVKQYQNGILTVTKAPLVLTANDKTRLYCEINPQFDYTVTGLRNNDTNDCITTSPSFNCLANQDSNAGKYEIIPANAFAKNYEFEYKSGTLTVNQRPLTAGVGDYSRKYNTANPEFEVEYIGFVNEEDSSVLSHPATVSCEATQISDVGSYTLTPTGGEAINYIITQYHTGKLTIEKAEQTLTWNQDLSNIDLYSQIALNATSDAGLPVTYEMSPNNVASLYQNTGTWYLDCYGSGAVSIRAIQNGDSNHNAASMITKNLTVNGSSNDPSNPQIYLDVPSAGTLSNLIAENRKYQIKNLRLTGYLNGTDINYLREMAGSDSYGSATPGILESLDISGCTILSGGRSYYRSYQTSNYSVSDYMFYNCKVLVNLILPENTTNIGSYALADCDRLSVLSIPNSVTSFGSYSFNNDISLLRIPMPSGLTSIGDMAFYGCNGLSEITIPRNVKYIGDGILNGCQNIAQINVENGNATFASERGVLYTVSFDELLIFPVSFASESFEVPDRVTRIAPYAFVNAKKLKDLTLPDKINLIGTDAFIGCVNLSSLTVLALIPPVCQNKCFDNVSMTRCTLRVPKGCYSYYWVAPVWSEFNSIVEIGNNPSEDNAVDDIRNDKINVYILDGTIFISGVPENERITILDSNGRILYSFCSSGSLMSYKPNNDGMFIIITETGKTVKVVK